MKTIITGQWISVTDQLPREFKQVFIRGMVPYAKVHSSICIGHCWDVNGTGIFQWDGVDMYSNHIHEKKLKNVTHWMYMPDKF